MINTAAFGDLAALDLGAFAAKPTSYEGDQQEASATVWTSSDGVTRVGVWECTPGRFTADRTAMAELCHILSGRVTLHDKDGTTRDFGPGEMFVLPKGWTGEWTIHSRTRKIYILSSVG
jgi:uncharacterized protein